MSFNIVKKSGSTCLVEKFRDPNNPKKVVEKYMCSMGVQTDEMHKYIRNQVNDLPQDKRLNWCEHSGFMVETSPDTLRRKTPTGDIREAKPKKERKPRKAKKPVEAKKEWLRYQETGYRGVYDPERARFTEQKKVAPTMTKAQIDARITRIRGDIKFSKKVVAQKRTVKIFGAMQKASVQRDIDYHNSVIDSGNKAIIILQKQKKDI